MSEVTLPLILRSTFDICGRVLDTALHLTMDWFLHDRDLRHERVKEKLFWAAEQRIGLHLTKNKESFVFTQGNIQVLDSTFSKKLLPMKAAKIELQLQWHYRHWLVNGIG